MALEDNSLFIRRSIRKYTDQAVSMEQITRILRAGMQAPSALDSRAWEFFVLRSQDDKDMVAGMSPYADMAAQASAVVIVCANMNEVEKNHEEAWWVQGLSACTENMLLQIVEEGLGGVWLGCYPREKRVEYLREKLDIPAHLIPFSVIPLGYPAEPNVYDDRFDADKVHIR